MKKLKHLLRDYQGLSLSLLLMSACLLVLIFVIVPIGKTILDLYETNKTVQQEVSALQAKVSVLTALDEADLTDKLQSLVRAIPLDKSLPSVFSTLEGAGSANQVSIDDISLGNTGALATQSARLTSAEEKKLGVSIQPMIFSAAGPIEQVRALLSTLHTIRRTMRVNSFDISFTEEGIARVKLSLHSFFAPLVRVTKSEQVRLLSPLTQKEEALYAQVQAYPIVSDAQIEDGGTPDVAKTFTDRADPFSF